MTQEEYQAEFVSKIDKGGLSSLSDQEKKLAHKFLSFRNMIAETERVMQTIDKNIEKLRSDFRAQQTELLRLQGKAFGILEAAWVMRPEEEKPKKEEPKKEEEGEKK